MAGGISAARETGVIVVAAEWVAEAADVCRAAMAIGGKERARGEEEESAEREVSGVTGGRGLRC